MVCRARLILLRVVETRDSELGSKRRRALHVAPHGAGRTRGRPGPRGGGHRAAAARAGEKAGRDLVNKSYTEYDSTKSTYYTVAPPAPRAQLQTPVGNNKFDYMDYI
jgi:hypothetical protein